MRKINQEITVRVPVAAAAPLSTGPGGKARHPGGCVWGLAGQSLDSAGPCHGRGTGRIPARAPQAAAEQGCPGARDFTRAQALRSHAPRRPHSPSTRFTRGLSFSLHLRASISASSLLSPSLSFDRPLLQARARVPIAAVAQTCRPRPGEGPVQPDPERAGGGKAERRGRPGRGGRGRRGRPGTPLSSRPQPRHLIPTCQPSWAPTSFPRLSPLSC